VAAATALPNGFADFELQFSHFSVPRYGGGSALGSWHAGQVPGTGTTLASGKRARAGAAAAPEPESKLALEFELLLALPLCAGIAERMRWPHSMNFSSKYSSITFLGGGHGFPPVAG
jgi:hypothetical protein